MGVAGGAPVVAMVDKRSTSPDAGDPGHAMKQWRGETRDADIGRHTVANAAQVLNRQEAILNRNRRQPRMGAGTSPGGVPPRHPRYCLYPCLLDVTEN